VEKPRERRPPPRGPTRRPEVQPATSTGRRRRPGAVQRRAAA
jgi:hypothetical protein